MHFAFYLGIDSPLLTRYFLLFQHVAYSRCSLSICGIIEWAYGVAAGPEHSTLILDIFFFFFFSVFF